MQAAFAWSKKNKIPARGFDARISCFNPGKTKRDNEKAIKEAEKIIKKFNWKDFNKPQYLKKLFTKSYYELVDLRQWKKREAQLANYILSRSKKLEGTIAIVTGCGHIPFFRKRFPDARFPLVTTKNK
jgi:hypothetical protein